MPFESNQPVSPLSIMAQHKRYQYMKQGMKTARKDAADKAGISQYTVNRVIQESAEAVMRNLGDIIVE